MTHPGQVLIVCTGNICRSPYIERRLAYELGGAAPILSSAGTRAIAGSAMHPISVSQLAAAGGDPDGFRARQLTPQIIDSADLVLCAARTHRTEVVRMVPRALGKTFALTDFADLVAHVPDGPLPVDPFSDPADAALTRLVRAAPRERESVHPRTDHAAAITDPIGRPEAAFARMAKEVEAVLPPLVRALRRR